MTLMKLHSFGRFSALAGLVVSSALVGSASAAEPDRYSGRASVYRQLSPESLEGVSTPETILKLRAGNVAPTEVWRVLERGEKVECLECIPVVEALLWNGDSRVREISAWWLRRRIFGVFGKGQVYSRVVSALEDRTQPEATRAYAANALGEFLTHAGVAPLSAAIRTDPSAKVREAAVRGLERMNSQGAAGELAVAMADADSAVRFAAVDATLRVNGFVDVAAVAGRLSDDSAVVRRRAVQVLGAMRASDSVAGLVALTSPAAEPEASVRVAAVYALGQIADPAARAAVEAAQADTDGFVRDAARVALRRL